MSLFDTRLGLGSSYPGPADRATPNLRSDNFLRGKQHISRYDTEEKITVRDSKKIKPFILLENNKKEPFGETGISASKNKIFCARKKQT